MQVFVEGSFWWWGGGEEVVCVALFKSKVWKVLSKGNNALAIPQHDSLQSADGKYEKKLENFHHKKQNKRNETTLESELVFKPVDGR